MPIFVMIFQHYHSRHNEFEIKCNVFPKYFLIFYFDVSLSEIFITWKQKYSITERDS